MARSAHPISRRLGAAVVAALAGLAAAAVLPVPAAACPFCPQITLTLSEQVSQSDAVALVQWVEGTKRQAKVPGGTVFEVVAVAKSPSKFPVAKGERIRTDLFKAGKKGDLFLLIGTVGAGDAAGAGTRIDWSTPIEITETGYQYMTQAPSPEQPAQKRLAYFLKFLEFPDDVVAADAFGEFANAPYKDLIPIAKSLPRERLRKWVTSPGTPATRLGMYGLMLGLCGNDEDAALIEKKISESSDEFRVGIDGVMAGYLLLTGDKGLDLIDETKLKAGTKAPFSETYAAAAALRFIWQYADGRIEKDRLRKSMRLLLDRPEIADMAVVDLSRWKDWSVQDRLMQIFDDDETYKGTVIKRAIVRYYMASIKDAPKEEGAAVPAHVTKGKARVLEKLREKDPETVQAAERFTLGP